MTRDSRRWYAARIAACALLFLVSIHARVSAQKTVPPDTTRAKADSTATPADSAAAPPDTASPPVLGPPLVDLPGSDSAAAGVQVWQWNRRDLLESGAFDMGDLLERLPGAMRIRTGVYGAAQALSVSGTAGGRIEFFLDGYPLDPLSGDVVDLSRLELASLRSVRVERWLDVVRVDLRSLRPEDPRIYSRVEAGTGDFDAELFRGQFVAPSFLGGPFAVSIERLQSQQVRTVEQATTSGAFVKWGRTFAGGDRGFEIEYRRGAVERDTDMPVPLDGHRTDFLVRGRTRIAGSLVGDAYYGRTSLDDAFPTVPPDTGAARHLEVKGAQIGARLGLGTPARWAEAAFRARTWELAPSSTTEVRGGAVLGGRITVSGRAALESGSDAGSALTAAAGVDAAIGGGLHVLADAAGGERGIRAPADSLPAETTVGRSGLRAGLGWRRGGFDATASFLRVSADSSATFGLDFDGPMRVLAGPGVNGVEGAVRVPLPLRGFYLEGWGQTWSGNELGLYLPRALARGSLAYRGAPVRNNPNFDVVGRVEAFHRGEMDVPAPGSDALVRLAPRTEMNLYFQLRIVDVRIFARWENMTNAEESDIPGRPLPPQRFFYGVKWQFWN